VEVNAGSYGSLRFLSRLGGIMMLIALQSIRALTCRMLPCIFGTMVGFVDSAAAASALPGCLSAFVDFL